MGSNLRLPLPGPLGGRGVYRSLLYLSLCNFCLRYIDDVLAVWSGTIEDLVCFMQELNLNDRNIKLTYSHHEKTLPFLDLQICTEGTRLISKTFRKEIAANTILQAHRYHPQPLCHAPGGGA